MAEQDKKAKRAEAEQQEAEQETAPTERVEGGESDPDQKPTKGDQGPQVAEQDAAAVGGFDPNRPVRQSPPPPNVQSGVPDLPENAGVEAQEEYRGPVEGSGQGTEEPGKVAPASPPEGGSGAKSS